MGIIYKHKNSKKCTIILITERKGLFTQVTANWSSGSLRINLIFLNNLRKISDAKIVRNDELKHFCDIQESKRLCLRLLLNFLQRSFFFHQCLNFIWAIHLYFYTRNIPFCKYKLIQPFAFIIWQLHTEPTLWRQII